MLYRYIIIKNRFDIDNKLLIIMGFMTHVQFNFGQKNSWFGRFGEAVYDRDLMQ